MPDGGSFTRRDAGLSCDDMPGLLPPAAARERLLAGVEPVAGTEVLGLAEALGRSLAAAPASCLDLPPYDQSAMDGYGLCASDLAPARAPKVIRSVRAGADPGGPLADGEAARLLTGAALPAGVAAVLMEEHADLRDGRVHPRRQLRAGDNIRRRGEDVARGEALAEPGTRLDPRHIALFAAAGVADVVVRRRVRIAVLSNGDELRGPVNDSNRPMLRAMLARPELRCTDLGVLPDDRAAIAAVLREAARSHDLIITSGGVSGSDADHLPGAIVDAGGTVETLKLALKPGKPLAHGRIGAALCLCLPGNPLAALVSMLVFGRPLAAHLAGDTAPGGPALAAVAGEAFARKPGREEYAPARIVGYDPCGLPVLARAGSGGSARLMPLSRADGLLWLPAGCAAVAGGDPLRFHPFFTPLGL
jgi:molybdopterin molybdotransferase